LVGPAGLHGALASNAENCLELGVGLCACFQTGMTLYGASSAATSDVQPHPLIVFSFVDPQKPKVGSNLLG